MLLALPEEQILCLARNIQAMFPSLNFQETWFRVMASLIPKKHIREVSTSFVPSVALPPFANSWVHLVTETASYLLEDSADSFYTAQTGR